MEPEEVLRLFRLKARARHYSAAEMSRFRNAYCKVTARLELKDYPIQPAWLELKAYPIQG